MTTLDRWFHVNVAQRSNYFIMNWQVPDQPAQWSVEKLTDESTFECVINWPELKTDVHIYGQMNRVTESPVPTQEKYKNIGFLKSQLQKAIRRQMSELAVKTAFCLWTLDPIALVRRLAIIILEDVYLHETYSTVIWLLVAMNNGLKGDSVILRFLLQVVEFYADFNYIDNLTVAENSRFIFRQNLSKIERDIEDPIDRGLLYSMTLHKALLEKTLPTLTDTDKKTTRGNNGEALLIENKRHIWFLRFCSRQTRYITLVHKPFIFDPVRPFPEKLRLNEWTLSAIDFHCAPMIVDWLQQKFPDLSRNEIREAIWQKRSNVNLRTYLGEKPVISDEVTRVWRKIQWNVEQNSIYILKHYH